MQLRGSVLSRLISPHIRVLPPTSTKGYLGQPQLRLLNALRALWVLYAW